MLADLVIVAVLADLLSTSAKRYAALYRQASDRLLHRSRGRTRASCPRSPRRRRPDADRGGPDPRCRRGRVGAGPAPSPLAQATMRRAQLLAAIRPRGSTRRGRRDCGPPRIHEIGLGAGLEQSRRSAGVPVDVRLDPAKLPPGLLEGRARDRCLSDRPGGDRQRGAPQSRRPNIWIDGDVIDGQIRLIVGDNGVGLDQSARGRGLGLDGMQERAGHPARVGWMSSHGRVRDGHPAASTAHRRPRCGPPDRDADSGNGPGGLMDLPNIRRGPGADDGTSGMSKCRSDPRAAGPPEGPPPHPCRSRRGPPPGSRGPPAGPRRGKRLRGRRRSGRPGGRLRSGGARLALTSCCSTSRFLMATVSRCCRALRSRHRRLRIVVLTMHSDPETVRQALAAGATGYLVKGAHSSELLEAIRAVTRGERYLHSSVTGRNRRRLDALAPDPAR